MLTANASLKCLISSKEYRDVTQSLTISYPKFLHPAFFADVYVSSFEHNVKAQYRSGSRARPPKISQPSTKLRPHHEPSLSIFASLRLPPSNVLILIDVSHVEASQTTSADRLPSFQELIQFAHHLQMSCSRVVAFGPSLAVFVSMLKESVLLTGKRCPRLTVCCHAFSTPVVFAYTFRWVALVFSWLVLTSLNLSRC